MKLKIHRTLSALLTVAALSATLVSCASSPDRSLTLDIASSLTPLEPAFTSSLLQRERVTAVVTADGTATLVKQISEGKPSDIVISADSDSLKSLIDSHLIDGDTVALATNKLVLAVPAANPARISSIDDLSRPDVKSVRCAAAVPCGKLAAAVISANKLSYTPLTETSNVSQATKLLVSGEAQAGFVYATDVLASGGKLIAINDPRLASITSIVTGAVLSSSTIKESAHRALSFWASTAFAQNWLEAGFTPLQK